MFSATLHQEVSQILAKVPKLDLRRREVLVANLQFLYHVIVASEKLLETACAQPCELWLHDYFFRHLSEERGHASWLCKDLEESGHGLAECSRLAATLPGLAYYHILHGHPAALLGYMLVLEGFPAPLAAVEELEILHGKALLRTVAYHAKHDVEHCQDLFVAMDNLPENLRSLVRRVALETASQFVEAFQYLKEVT